jgi:sugar diacid utilization regulator
MASALQQLVDSLSRRLQRAVVIDDPNAEQQVFNSQFGDIDDSRRRRILSRAGDDDVAAYFWSFRTPWPAWPIRIPAQPEIGVESRVYMPIRHQEELLGHLWVFDRDCRVAEEDFELLYSTAESAALILNREQLLFDLERSRERELVRDLLSTDKAMRAQAADDLVGSDLFPLRSPVKALVVQPVRPGDGEPDQAVRTAIGKAMEYVRGSLTPGYVLTLVRNDHGLMLLSPMDPAVRTNGVDVIARELLANLENNLECLEQGEWRVVSGFGDEHSTLAGAITSYEQARHAVRVASVAPSFGPVTHWDRLGIYRMLSHFPLQQLASEALHPAVTELASNEDAYALLRTLEMYLDSGCDAKATAADLFIHRGTLYYRLKRISEITGADMTSGEERLAIHLSLKLGRLTGLFGEETSLGLTHATRQRTRVR